MMSNELFYTEGTQELRQARLDMAQFSINRAAQRIVSVKRRRDDPELGLVSRKGGGSVTSTKG